MQIEPGQRCVVFRSLTTDRTFPICIFIGWNYENDWGSRYRYAVVLDNEGIIWMNENDIDVLPDR